MKTRRRGGEARTPPKLPGHIPRIPGQTATLPVRPLEKPKKRYTWKHWVMGISGVALIVAGIYWKYPRATPEQVAETVKTVGGKAAETTLKENPRSVLEKAAQVDPIEAKQQSIVNDKVTKAATTAKRSGLSVRNPEAKKAVKEETTKGNNFYYTQNDDHAKTTVALKQELIRKLHHLRETRELIDKFKKQANDADIETKENERKAAQEDLLVLQERHKQLLNETAAYNERKAEAERAAVKPPSTNTTLRDVVPARKPQANEFNAHSLPDRFKVKTDGEKPLIFFYFNIFAGYKSYLANKGFKSWYLYRNSNGHWIISKSYLNFYNQDIYSNDVGNLRSTIPSESPINLNYELITQRGNVLTDTKVSIFDKHVPTLWDKFVDQL